MTRPIPPQAVSLYEAQETCVLRVYDDAHPDKILMPGDPVDGTLTGGYGHTKGLKIGDVVTQDIANAWVPEDLGDAATALEEKIGGDVVDDLTDNQYAALLDFVANVGTGNPKKPEWTIWARLRARQYDQIPLELAKFVNVHWDDRVVKLNGLVERRNAEIALWGTAEPGSVPVSLPSSVTRTVATPPTPADPDPPQKSKTLLTGAATVVASGGVAVKQVSDAITPYAAQSHTVASTVAILASVAAGLAGLTVLFFWLNKRKARN